MKYNYLIKLAALLWVFCGFAGGSVSQAGSVNDLQSCLSVCNNLSRQTQLSNLAQLVQECNFACNSVYGSGSSASRNQVIDQQSQQVVRQISTLISSRIASNINPAFSAPLNVDTKQGAGDANSWMPDSLWSTAAYSRLSSNGNTNGQYNADIYQSTTGVDKNIGNFYFGTTVNYAGTTEHIQSAGMYGSNHLVGITPYMAYAFNKNIFLSGLTGYNYATSNYRGVAPDSQLDAYQSELDLNGLHVIDQWFMKGKIGTRYLHTYNRISGTSATPATSNNLDTWTYLAETEAGYNFGNGIRAFSGILYEHTEPATVTIGGVSTTSRNNIFYYSAGADYAMTKKFTLGTKIQTDLNNTYSNLTTISLNARLQLD